MKTQFSFADVTKIFNAVARIETKSNKLEIAKASHDKLSAEFDAEFSKLGYTFDGASQEVHDMFEAKCKAMDGEEKAEKSLWAEVKKFAKMVGIGEGYDDIVAEELKSYMRNRYYCSGARMVRNVKYMAKRAAERIDY